VTPRTSAGVGSKCHPKSVVVEIGKEADNVKTLVVDDHVLIRSALRDVLKEVKGDATVLEASSCSQAMHVIAEHPGLATFRRKIRRSSPAISVTGAPRNCANGRILP
jgi:predicted metallo-beta-lactamase superfamily hydrolase